MAQKPQPSTQTKRTTFDQRGEQLKEPVYMAPPNPIQPNPKKNK